MSFRVVSRSTEDEQTQTGRLGFNSIPINLTELLFVILHNSTLD